MLSETRERFVKAILAQIPVERIAEIHFFAPMRQAGIESGVAVVAVDEAMAAPPESPASGDIDAVPQERPSSQDSPPHRYAVYTARYRLVLKGPERGKWETNVVAEADAPLLTVDAVVRGVQRRSGEADDPERMAGEEVRAALGAR